MPFAGLLCKLKSGRKEPEEKDQKERKGKERKGKERKGKERKLTKTCLEGVTHITRRSNRHIGTIMIKNKKQRKGLRPFKNNILMGHLLPFKPVPSRERVLLPEIHKGEMGLVAPPARLGVVAPLPPLPIKGLLRHGEGVPEGKEADNKDLPKLPLALCILSGIREGVGEVDSVAIVTVVGGSDHPEPVVDYPASPCFACS